MQRNHLNKLFFTAVVLFAASSCKKQEYYQVNPNLPSVASPALLLTNIAASTFNLWPMEI